MLPVMLKRRQRSGWPMLPIPAPKLVPPSHTRQKGQPASIGDRIWRRRALPG